MKSTLCIPDSKNYFKQWHLHSNFKSECVSPYASVQAEDAWLSLGNFGSREITVGVLDDDFNIFHEPLSEKDKIIEYTSFNGDEIVTRNVKGKKFNMHFFETPLHGTCVAALAVGGITQNYPVGVAPNCSLLPISLGKKRGRLTITEEKFCKALEYLSDKVDIVINSWSKVPIFEFSEKTIDIIKSMYETGGRRNKGILFVWAAGNWNCPINYWSTKQIPYKGGLVKRGQERIWFEMKKSNSFVNNIFFLKNVIATGAITSLAKRAHYSCYGDGLSVVAPSNNNHSAGLRNLRGLGLTTSYGNMNGITDNFKGTSGAAAIAAGVAALTLSANHTLTAVQLAEILKTTSDKKLDFSSYEVDNIDKYDPNTLQLESPDSMFWDGSFNVDGWSSWFGHGKVNALRGVIEAKRLLEL